MMKQVLPRGLQVGDRVKLSGHAIFGIVCHVSKDQKEVSYIDNETGHRVQVKAIYLTKQEDYL